MKSHNLSKYLCSRKPSFNIDDLSSAFSESLCITHWLSIFLSLILIQRWQDWSPVKSLPFVEDADLSRWTQYDVLGAITWGNEDLM